MSVEGKAMEEKPSSFTYMFVASSSIEVSKLYLNEIRKECAPPKNCRNIYVNSKIKFSVIYE